MQVWLADRGWGRVEMHTYTFAVAVLATATDLSTYNCYSRVGSANNAQRTTQHQGVVACQVIRGLNRHWLRPGPTNGSIGINRMRRSISQMGGPLPQMRARRLL